MKIEVGGHDKFHFRNDREKTYKTVHEIGELAQKGCVKCFLVYHGCVKVFALSETQQRNAKVFWNIGYPQHHTSVHGRRSGHGTVYLSHPTLPLHTIQIYSGANDHPLKWKFIRPMGHILQDRREEPAPLLNKWVAECNRSHLWCCDRIRNGRLPTRVINVGNNKGQSPFLYISSQERGR